VAARAKQAEHREVQAGERPAAGAYRMNEPDPGAGEHGRGRIGGTGGEVAKVDEVRAYERRFRRAGLPLFIEDFRASTDVFNRAVPLLGLVFLGETLNALNLEWSPLANLAAVAGGLAILLCAVGVANRARGRPFRSVPRTVGRVELALFVIVPALLPLIFGGQWRSSLVIAGANLLLLALIYAFLGLGLVAILRWVAGRMLGQLRGSLMLIARAVPLLAIFALLSFTTEEMWLIFSSSAAPIYWLMIGLFVVLGTAFVAARIPRETRALEREACPDGPPLQRRQLLNVGFVMFVSQALQVLIVSVVVGLFFAVFGLLAVSEPIREAWLGSAGNEVVSFDLFGEQVAVTEELLRVATSLAAFSGFYFAIAMLTDSTYREEFLAELTGEMRDSFEARSEYLRLREAPASA
jgi:hypothetical protein